jgi:hypothetical protein
MYKHIPYLSIVIPCYAMNGHGAELLNYSLQILANQTFKDFEVVISDHSIDTDKSVENCCNNWIDKLDIKYFRNTKGIGIAPININFGLIVSRGKIIKILCQDDYLYDNTSLQLIVDAFDDTTKWLVTTYIHTKDKINYINRHVPTLNDNIHVINTIGTLSTLAILNKDILLYDETLTFAYDCEYYARLIKKFGPPKILDIITMVNYLWNGQTTNTLVDGSLIQRENSYIIEKMKNA